MIQLIWQLFLAWWRDKITRKTRQYEADASARTIITGKPDVMEAETTHKSAGGKVKQSDGPLNWK